MLLRCAINGYQNEQLCLRGQIYTISLTRLVERLYLFEATLEENLLLCNSLYMALLSQEDIFIYRYGRIKLCMYAVLFSGSIGGICIAFFFLIENLNSISCESTVKNNSNQNIRLKRIPTILLLLREKQIGVSTYYSRLI